MKNVSYALWATFVAVTAYIFLVIFLGKITTTEDVINIMDIWEFNLNLEVPIIFNIFFIPLIALIAFLLEHQTEIAGKEPKESEITLSCKHNAKLAVLITSILSLVISGGSVILMAFVSLFNDAYGPLSNLGNLLLIGGVIYVIMGCCVQALMTFTSDRLGWFESEEQKDMVLMLKFKSTLISFAKIGIISTIPFMLGHIMGFTFRFVIRRIIQFFVKQEKSRQRKSLLKNLKLLEELKKEQQL